MNRQQHLVWAKERAIEIVNAGDLDEALTSMYSDFGKYPETVGHLGIQLGFMQQISGLLNTSCKVIKFINGFN